MKLAVDGLQKDGTYKTINFKKFSNQVDLLSQKSGGIVILYNRLDLSINTRVIKSGSCYVIEKKDSRTTLHTNKFEENFRWYI